MRSFFTHSLCFTRFSSAKRRGRLIRSVPAIIWLVISLALSHAQSPCVRTGTADLTIGGQAAARIGSGIPVVCLQTATLTGPGAAGPVTCEGASAAVSITQSGIGGGGTRIVVSGSASSAFPDPPQSNHYEGGASGGVNVRAVGGPLRIVAVITSMSVHNGVLTTGRTTNAFTMLENDIAAFSGSCGAITRSGPGLAPAESTCSGTLATIDIFPTNTSQPTSFSWTNVAGGDYGIAANWSPDCDFPQHSGTRSDVASFTSLATPVTVNGSAATAGRWSIVANHLTFNGNAELFSPLFASPSLTMSFGGTLFLNGNLRSQHTVIDGINSNSVLQVLNGGSWENAASARIGLGTLSVFDTASTDELIIGTNRGPARVESTLGGTLTVNRVLTVGDTHPGTMEITDGGAVQVTQPNLEPAIIGHKAQGVVNVRDSGRLLVDHTLIIGELNNGRFEIGNAGYARVGSLKVNGSLGDGRLVVGGLTDSAVLDVNNSLFVSAIAATEVLITNRAVVSTPELVIGFNQIQPGTAEVMVRGPNAHLNVDDTFPGAGQPVQTTQIGINAAGQLTVADGAQADLNGGLTLGTSAQGTLLVSSFNAPAQSRVRVKSDAVIGAGGRGVLLIGDDALLTVDGDMDIGMGGGSPSGTVTVNPQSFLTVNGTLSVGANGEGHLTADHSSFVTVNGSAFIGENLLGIFNVLNGSVARCDDLFVGGITPGAVGIIVVDAASELKITGNAQVGIDLGRGEIHLSSASVLNMDGNMEIGNPGGGSGSGALTLSGATVNGSSTSTIKVNTNGALTGTGTINLCGVCRIPAGGVISPGLSPGLLTINGNLDQLSSGVLIIEVAGLAPGQFDVLAVSGDVTLGGTLEVRFLDGFLPKQGDRIALLSLGGALSNNFAQIVLPQAAPGFDAELNLSPNGKLQLVARNDAVAGTGTTITSPPLTLASSLRFTQFSLNAGQLALAWTTTPGRSYRIEANNSLNGTNWTTLSTNIPANGNSLSMNFSISDTPRRFYRVAESESP